MQSLFLVVFYYNKGENNMPNHIKIYGVKPRIQYVADGTLSAFEFPFAIFKTSDVDVYFDDKLQDQATYTVSGNNDTQGGSVIFKTAPAKGIIVSIIRNLSIERTTDFQEGGALRAKVLNDEFDYQTACLQQVADNLNRSMVLPPYATDTDVDLTLPTPSAGKAIVWNKDGTNLENSVVEVNALESTLRTYKESAESSATIATEKATLASDKADTATEQAQVATEKASLATQKATETANALSAKANTDMDNLTTAGKNKVSLLSFPSATYVDFTLGETGSYYTAPADGWLIISKRSNSESAQYLQIACGGMYNIQVSERTSQREVCCVFPLGKGQRAKYNYTLGGNTVHSRFVYSQGGKE